MNQRLVNNLIGLRIDVAFAIGLGAAIYADLTGSKWAIGITCLWWLQAIVTAWRNRRPR